MEPITIILLSVSLSCLVVFGSISITLSLAERSIKKEKAKRAAEREEWLRTENARLDAQPKDTQEFIRKTLRDLK